MLTVSIITAVKNGVADIGATLRSVESQTHSTLQHIVVDGGSTDGTKEFVEASGKRVSELVSEKDNGVYDAFNKGLRRSTGDVVGFLNAGDTYVEPTTVSVIASRLEETGADALFGDLIIVKAENHSKIVRHYSSSRFSPGRIRFGIMPAHPTLYVRRSLYDRLGGYDPTYRIAGDFELIVRLFAKLKCSYVYEPRVLVRMPRGGLSTAGFRSKRIITREMLRACASNGIRTNLAKLLILRVPLKLMELRLGLI